jgi:hypothetical protein
MTVVKEITKGMAFGGLLVSTVRILAGPAPASGNDVNSDVV